MADDLSHKDPVAFASQFITVQGYRHGPCLSVRQLGNQNWEVEFAHEGQSTRSLTTDPSSILLLINLEIGTVTLLEPM